MDYNWEDICTRCGKCCLIKLQNDDTEEIYYTNVACKYLNHSDCSCKEYENRCTLVPECLKLTPENISQIIWIPKTCAYKILDDTGKLPLWHPLISGKTLEDKYSIKGRCVCETEVNEEDLEDYIIDEE